MTTNAAQSTATLRVTRLIKAARERVFAAWTTPEEIVKWFGPEECRALSAKVDLRVGGEYHFRIKGERFGELELRGVYREVKPPTRLVYTWNWKGNRELEFGETLVTVDFVDRNGFTEVQITHDRLPGVEQRESHSHGWNGSLDKLAAQFGEPAKQAPDKSPGIFCWNELVTRDPDASTKFYTQLFGWNAEAMSMGPGMNYTFLKSGGQDVGGLLKLPPEAGNFPTAWMAYVTVTDLPAAVAKAKSLGAKICKDITNLPMGRFAIITDPQGAALGLWQFSDQGGTCS